MQSLHERIKCCKCFVVPSSRIASCCGQNLTPVVDSIVVGPCCMGRLESQVWLAMLVRNPFEDDVRCISWANCTRKASICVLCHVFESFLSTWRCQHIALIQNGTAELEKSVKKPPHAFLTDAGIFRKVFQSPRSSQVAKNCQEEERDWGSRKSKTISRTLSPMTKLFGDFKFSCELKEVGIWDSESSSKFC